MSEQALIAKEKRALERREEKRLVHEGLERERRERERQVRERLEVERWERERLAQEQLERERREREQLVQERLERERQDREWLAQEQLEIERQERERLVQERLEIERRERERLAQERLEIERRERERLVQEQLELEWREQERLALASLEAELREEERLALARLEVEWQEQERGALENSVALGGSVVVAEQSGAEKGSVLAQGSVSSEPPLPTKSRSFAPWPKLFSIRHVWGDQGNSCIPFASNYTTVEVLFAPEYQLGSVMPLLDVRGHRFDNNTYAANAGIGGRYIPNPKEDGFCDVLGFNAYYDYRQGCVGYYQQIGVGLEIIGRRWDFFANAYAPVGPRRHIRTCVYDDYVGDYIATLRTIESVTYTFNAEAGYLIYNSEDFSLLAAAGPYFLARSKCSDGVVGAEARLKPKYKDYVGLDLSWRYDRLFRTIWQVEIVLTLPLYRIRGQNSGPCEIADRQIYQAVQRFEVMPLNKHSCWQTNF